jgi:1-acyl-sn-glycerol-3-phosphate acyltransferase
MIKPWQAKIITSLPDGVFRLVSNKLVDNYLDKYANIKVEGLDKIKNEDGPFIFIGNHLSNSDGLVLNKVLKNFDPFFVAGVKLSNDPLTKIGAKMVKTITIKPNSADKEALTTIVKTVKEGNNIFIFPEGTRSRTGAMIEAKKGILLIAKLTKAKIVPISMTGTEKLMPVNKEGDMAKEKFYHADVFIKVGEPFTLPKKEKDEDKNAFEDRTLEYIMKSIAKGLPESYRGFYR